LSCLAYLFLTSTHPHIPTLSTPATGTKVVLKKLTFKSPPTTEEQPFHGEQQLEEVGKITLEVFNAVRKKRTFHKGLVTETNEFNNIHDVARGVEIASATLAEEGDIVDDIEFVSNFRIGGKRLETLEVRFGYENQLLLLGADARFYRNSQLACRIPRGAMRTPTGYTTM
jgi:hypothetical protein